MKIFMECNWTHWSLCSLKTGDLAQTALLKTSANEASVGPRAHWNRTFCPREAALESAEVSMMTNAEMYGGIDGLLMARRIENWDNRYTTYHHDSFAERKISIFLIVQFFGDVF